MYEDKNVYLSILSLTKQFMLYLLPSILILKKVVTNSRIIDLYKNKRNFYFFLFDFANKIGCYPVWAQSLMDTIRIGYNPE